MCICTQYDGHCGHSWLSNSQPCGAFQDFLNCPNRSICQFLVAPPNTCPTCFGGFADPETMQMIQGPWGCNQMLRNHWGGDVAIPGAWGTAPLLPQHGAGTALVANEWSVDHRLTGPISGPVGMHGMAVGTPIAGPVAMPVGMPVTGPRRMDSCAIYDNYYDDGYGTYGGRDRRNSSHHYREYRHKYRSGADCVVM